MENTTYDLDYRNFNGCCSRYTIFKLKLTDSALNAIDQYKNFKKTLPRKPTVKFQEKTGIMTIPVPQQGDKKYQLTLSKILDPEDCVLHGSHKSNKLVAIGVQTHKIQVGATEEIFEHTRERINAVEKERQKDGTQEITKTVKKNSSKGVNRKITDMRTLPRPISPYNRGKKPTPPSSQTNGLLLSKSLKERVIHILALKPYNRPELIMRLDKDGRSEDAHNPELLSSVLKEVAVQSRDNYILNPQLYAQVKPNWPGFSVEDRAFVENRKRQKVSRPDNEETAAKRSKFSDFVPIRKTRGEQRKELEDMMKEKKSLEQKTANNEKEKPTELKVEKLPSEPDYHLQYVPITNEKQYQNYVEDYKSQYEEYLNLHKFLAEVYAPFRELQQQLKTSTEGTNEYNELCVKVNNEFQRVKKDENFSLKKKRFDFLHSKLKFIKELTKKYEAAEQSKVSRTENSYADLF
ncbi:DgyrCDS10957 [Dimorphilus gyrociliatus]|uniref:DgyrCDS10957 n=1 Tax=Dimorphilus gyrociliatus TaxID=2664684 RepID=A0A7I8W303_9ANNE|nr:DgyrCDS10957 [Dimorphilus gyrociliatus]